MQLAGFGNVASGVGIVGQAALTKVGISAAERLAKGVRGKKKARRKRKAVA